MSFNIQNNKLYYKDLNITGQLSWILIPLSIYIIIYKKELIKYFSYIFIAIAILGSIEAFYITSILYNYYFYGLILIILHILLLYPLLNFKKYFKPNTINYVLTILGIIILKYLPYWPYELSREFMIYGLIINALLLRSIYYILY